MLNANLFPFFRVRFRYLQSGRRPRIATLSRTTSGGSGPASSGRTTAGTATRSRAGRTQPDRLLQRNEKGRQGLQGTRSRDGLGTQGLVHGVLMHRGLLFCDVDLARQDFLLYQERNELGGQGSKIEQQMFLSHL